MLMHTKGILVMMPDSTMVLTGNQALEYSGGVSAHDRGATRAGGMLRAAKRQVICGTHH